ncbi:MAG: serine/threonine-protein kinase [Planctomycetota bacterium]
MKRTMNCLDQDTIERFLDEKLSGPDSTRTESHLAECKSCQSRLDEFVTRGRGWKELSVNLKDLAETKVLSSGDRDEELEPVDLSQLLAPTDDPESLGRLGRYEIRGMIGRGSAGIVLKGRDPSLNRFVAIKVLAPSFAFVGSSRKRFEREARAIASVNHHNVIEVHGVDEYQQRPYMVMKYFPDGSLQRRIDRDGWLTTTQVCRIGMQVASGLAEAHRQGIIHRDIKPANILIEEGTERAVLTDFGLASVADEATMTRSGTIAGTPQYMSPEQACGHTLDVRSDLFSLGSAMYTACTGKSPFRAPTLMGVVNQVCEAQPRPILEINPDIAPWLAAFIDKLLAKDREERFQSAEEVDQLLAAELAYLQMPAGGVRPERGWLKTSPRWRNPKTIATAFGVALLLIAGLITAAFSAGNQPVNLAETDNSALQATIAEQTFIEAKAAFDLAYHTHLNESELRGDMPQSIKSHQQALELGFDPPTTLYNLACAYAYQGDNDEALAWLEKACDAGFHDLGEAQSDRELKGLRKDPRMIVILQRIETLSDQYHLADSAYFNDEDYELAEKLNRERLRECPDDEHAKLMVGAALLEQGKYEEARPWNEMARQSVRYANLGSYNLGCIEAQRGNFDRAFLYLNHAIDCGFSDTKHLLKDHHLKPLHEDPRFKLLIQRTRDKSIRLYQGMPLQGFGSDPEESDASQSCEPDVDDAPVYRIEVVFVPAREQASPHNMQAEVKVSNSDSPVGCG